MKLKAFFKYKVFFWLLLALVLNTIYVIACFSWFADSRIAGLFAGLGFLAVNLCNQTLLLRQGLWKGPSGVLHAFFLVFSVFPMIIMRLIHWQVPFEDLVIFGLAGEQFHWLSTQVFKLMIVVIVVEWVWRSLRDMRHVH